MPRIQPIMTSHLFIHSLLNLKRDKGALQVQDETQHLISQWSALHIPNEVISTLLNKIPIQEYPEIWASLAKTPWACISNLNPDILKTLSQHRFHDPDSYEPLFELINDEIQLTHESSRLRELIHLAQLALLFLPDVNKVYHVMLGEDKTSQPYSALFLALYYGFLNPLSIDPKTRSLAIIPVLLIQGANPNGLAAHENILVRIIKSPLSDTSTGIKLIHLLMSYHLDIYTFQFEILSQCIRYHRHQLLSFLLDEYDAFSETHVTHHKPALLEAAIEAHDNESIQILLEHGALNQVHLIPNESTSDKLHAAHFTEIIKTGEPQIVAYTLHVCLFRLKNPLLFEYIEREIPALAPEHPTHTLTALIRAFRAFHAYSQDQRLRSYFRQHSYRSFAQHLYEQCLKQTLDHYIRGNFLDEKLHRDFLDDLHRLIHTAEGDDNLVKIVHEISQTLLELSGPRSHKNRP